MPTPDDGHISDDGAFALAAHEPRRPWSAPLVITATVSDHTTVGNPNSIPVERKTTSTSQVS